MNSLLVGPGASRSMCQGTGMRLTSGQFLSVIMEISRGILFQVFPDRGLEHVEITGGGRLRSVGPGRYTKERDLDRAGANVCTLKR